jgi:nitrite reductase (cytochrome c-552)
MTCKTAQLADMFKDKVWDYAKIPLLELLPQLKHPIVCANCHDPKTMNLRVINPAFIEAMAQRGVDVKKASREEMRSDVCGQCHAEYYFVPSYKKVVFPLASPYKGREPLCNPDHRLPLSPQGRGNLL